MVFYVLEGAIDAKDSPAAPFASTAGKNAVKLGVVQIRLVEWKFDVAIEVCGPLLRLELELALLQSSCPEL